MGAQGLLTAENTQAVLNPGAPSITATWNPATGTYVDSSGNHYNQSGNPVNLGAPPGPAMGGSGGVGNTGGAALPAGQAPVYQPGAIARPGTNLIG